MDNRPRPAREVTTDKIERRAQRRARSAEKGPVLPRGIQHSGGEWTPGRRRPDPTGKRAERRRGRCTTCHGTGTITRLRGRVRESAPCGCVAES